MSDAFRGVVRGPLGRHPMFLFEWICPHRHRTQPAAQKCAERERRRRDRQDVHSPP